MSTQSIEVPNLEAKVQLYRNSQGQNGLLGFADLVIAGAFIIKGICIRTSKADPATPFLSFPARRGTGEAQDRYFDIAFPITAEAYSKAKELILEKYREATGEK